jgi:hypothetical protein
MSGGGASVTGTIGGGTPSGGQGNAGASVNVGGDSGDNAMGTTAGEAGEAAGGATNDAGDLLTDPLVPHCDDGTGMNYELRGTLDGQTVDLKTSLASTLDLNTFQVLEVDGSALVEPLVLTWTSELSQDTAIPLTGTSIMIPPGGQSYCVTSGSFGSPYLAVGDGHARKLLFHLTGLRVGDCSGPPVDVDLRGCFSREANFFPAPGQVVILPVDPSRPDLPADKHINDLTDEEKAELCDWMNLEYGGYGHSTECYGPGTTNTITAKDRAQCLLAYIGSACSWDTVGSVEICWLSEAPTHGCFGTPECDNVLSCP